MGQKPPYHYSPVTERPFELPENNQVALWVIPNIEYFKFDVPYPNDKSGYNPNVMDYSWRDYGTRVGIWRLIDILDEYDITATVALNAAVCDHSPSVVEAGMERDWEFMGHGITNSERLAELDNSEEREVIQQTRNRIEEFTNTKPQGWLSPGLTETFDTPYILAEEGFSYICDWVNDDQPYVMEIDKGPLISIPYSTEINDIPLFLRRNVTGPEFEQTIKDQFDVLYKEGNEENNAKVMAIALHPYISGHPHRSKYLSNALEYITNHDKVWTCTGLDIAQHYIGNYL